MEARPLNTIGTRLLQIFVGAAILYRILTEFPFAQYFYGTAGPMLGGTTPLLGFELGSAVDRMVYSPTGIAVFHVLWLAGAVGLIAGWRTSCAALLALIGYVWAEARSITHDGGDNVMRIVLLYMVFFSAAAAGARQTRTPPRPGARTVLHNLAVLATYVQLCLLYLVASTLKFDGDVWKNGTALYYVTQVNWFAPPWPWMQEMFKNPWIVTLATYSAVLYQVGFPFMLLNRLHWVWVVLGVGFHIGIGVVMGLVSFSIVMMGLVLFTVRDSEWAAASRTVSRLLPRFDVWIDGHCPVCVRTGRVIRRLDWLGLATVRSFRHDQGYEAQGLALPELERRMHLHLAGSPASTVQGFQAVLHILKSLPALWPLWPVATLLATAGLGERAYGFLADRRILVPDARACQADQCPLPSLGSSTE
ncbi:DUF393 domain-containing protein [Deinococcus sp. 14RED07]|uniref:DCC1-like thiol-disulfide oxidoreductase family protein n=1 Tax=Deinococcus sp. 14RED07 TaxID=2745874 RepID=UPI001E3CBFE4|nr:DCC1-like thiol-disulfide oxidoreductase family protein [Deinococcus sp. 14RED07]MCD0175655.1 DUF393 domain-containing protein [Deinococcus sp. 14RED07]